MIPETIQNYKKAILTPNPSYNTLALAASTVIAHPAVQQYLTQVTQAYTNNLYGKSYNQAIANLPQEVLQEVANSYQISTEQAADLYRLHLID